MLCLCFYIEGTCQITISEDFTTEQMVVDILVNNNCIDISNITSSTGSNFGNVNGIGVFDANGSNFPFASGIVLTSGNVIDAAGPNTNESSGGTPNWPGDSDLEANTNVFSTNNASSIEFDFIPQVSTISFNFLMASEEYNQQFECSFSDAFAFILTDQNTGEVQNLAVLPGTDIPIEVTNIREQVPGLCGAVNPEFFDKYNFQPFNDENLAPINYNGQTVVLTATGEAIIGNTYSLKLVVADAGVPGNPNDTQLDIAVFLEAGSFNFGIDLGPDLSLDEGNPYCGEETGFEIGVIEDPSGAIQYQWYVFDEITNGFVIIPGETTNTLFVDGSGIYQIEAIITSGCTIFDEIVIDFFDPPFANTPDPYFVCDTDGNDGISTFDLTEDSLISQILGNQDPAFYSVSFFETLANAQANLNAVATNYQNTSNPQQLFARVEITGTVCFAITDLTLNVQNSPELFLQENYRICVDQNLNAVPETEGEPSPAIIETGLNSNTFNFTWFLNGQEILGESNPSLVANTVGNYSVFIENMATGCSSTFDTTVFNSSAPFSITAEVVSEPFSPNHVIQTTVTGVGEYSYILDFGEPRDTGIFFNVAPGPHLITIIDNNGCGSLSLEVFVIDFPDYFTPNEDGFNDRWNIPSIVFIDPLAVVYIFDRFGILLFQTSVTAAGWDGVYNGTPMPENDYWFLLKYDDNGVTKEYRNHFTLKR